MLSPSPEAQELFSGFAITRVLIDTTHSRPIGTKCRLFITAVQNAKVVKHFSTEEKDRALRGAMSGKSSPGRAAQKITIAMANAHAKDIIGMGLTSSCWQTTESLIHRVIANMITS